MFDSPPDEYLRAAAPPARVEAAHAVPPAVHATPFIAETMRHAVHAAASAATFSACLMPPPPCCAVAASADAEASRASAAAAAAPSSRHHDARRDAHAPAEGVPRCRPPMMHQFRHSRDAVLTAVRPYLTPEAARRAAVTMTRYEVRAMSPARLISAMMLMPPYRRRDDTPALLPSAR